jgi:accessory colonization factor AcfC
MTTSIEKGEEISLIKGNYTGQKAWMNKAKEPTKCMFFIIVEHKGGELATRVLKTSVRLLTNVRKPSSFEEALFQQHPDIEQVIVKLATLLVKCGMDENSKNLQDILQNQIEGALSIQTSLKHKATWRHVDYPSDH